MKTTDLETLIKDHEIYFASLGPAVAARKDVTDRISRDKLETLAEKMGDPEKALRLVRALPEKPAPDDVIAAFGSNVERLGTLVNDTLGGDANALSWLLTVGCQGKADKLASFADTFKDGEPQKQLKALVAGGGFAGNPKALAEVLAHGCDGDADKLKDFVEGMKEDTDRQNLAAVMGGGGLGAAPGALAGMVKAGGADMVKKLGKEFAADTDQPKLKALLAKGGFGGDPADNPATLASVITAFGDDPAKLKNLHDAFPGEPEKLGLIVRSLDAKPEAGKSKSGPRLKKLCDSLGSRGGAATEQAKFDRLKDPFLKSFESTGRDRGVPPSQAAGQLTGLKAAAKGRPKVSAALGQGMVETGLDAGQANALLLQSGMSPADLGKLSEPDRKAKAAELVGKAGGDTGAFRAVEAEGLLDALPGGTDAEKAARKAAKDDMKKVSGAAMGAAVSLDQAKELLDQGDGADARIKELMAQNWLLEHGSAPEPSDVLDMDSKAKEACEAAAKAAEQAANDLDAAPRPVDPSAIAAVAHAAEVARQAAAKVADRTDRDKGLLAAKAAAEAVGRAASDTADQIVMQATLADPDSKAGMQGARNANATADLLSRLPGDQSAVQKKLREAGDAATAGALTAVEAERFSKDANAKAAAEAAMKRTAAAGGIKETDAQKFASDAANDAAKDAEDAAAKLTPTPYKPDSKDIKAASDAAAKALAAAKLAVDDTARNRAVTAAKAAAKAAADAATQLAKSERDAATTTMSGTAKTSIATSRGSQDAYITARGAELKVAAGPGRHWTPEAGGTTTAKNTSLGHLNDAREKISDAGSLRLATIAADTPAIQDAERKAEQSAALAELPGAPPLARLTAATDARDAATALALEAKAKATAAANAVPTPTNAAKLPATDTHVEGLIRTANEVLKGALAAAVKRVETARKARDIALLLLPAAKERAAHPAKTATDDEALTTITDVSTDTNADKSKTLKQAETDIRELDATCTELAKRAKACTDFCHATLKPEISTAAGFAALVGLEATKMDGEPPPPPATHEMLAGAKDSGELILAASTIGLQDPSGLGDKANVGTNVTADMAHHAGRHTRSHQPFKGRDLHDEAELAAALMVKAQTTAGPSGDRSDDAKAIANQTRWNKPTTLWPEGVGNAEVQQYVKDAIKAAETGLGLVSPATLGGRLWDPVALPHKFENDALAFTGTVDPKLAYKVMIVVEKANAAPKVHVPQFAPVGEQSFTVMDLQLIRRALG